MKQNDVAARPVKLNEEYLMEKLFEIFKFVKIEYCETNHAPHLIMNRDKCLPILKQIARDARAEQAGRGREAVRKLNIFGIAGYPDFIVRERALAALDRAKGE